MSTAVKRACDACHRRKVKCDGVNPCRNCAASQLSCTYNAIPQKKGPKGSRAKVISELRETQRQTSLSAKSQNRMNGQPSTPSLAPTPGLLTPEMVKECIEFYFANMYTTMPILHRQRLEQQSLFIDQSPEAYCLMTSLCALMLLQPGMTTPAADPFSFDIMPGANIVTATRLVDETLRVRKSYDYHTAANLNTLSTSYFVFACYHALEDRDKAWFHLREATTLIHMTDMNREENYRQYDAIEASRRRRLYWLFFVTERAYALQRGRPLSLQATINTPTLADDPTEPHASQLGGFILLVNTFRPIDDSLVTLWARVKGDCSQHYVAAMLKQLHETLPPYLNSHDSQLAELPMNQQWLKNLRWRLSMANESTADIYSSDSGRDLLSMASNFPGNLGLVGLGLLDKLCEVSCALIEYQSMQPASRDPFNLGPREHLHQVLNVLTMLRNGEQRLLPLLLSRVHDILPRMVNPILQNTPENACSIDIFDGFGNAGMGHQTIFPTEEYDNKFAVPRIDEVSNDSGSSTGGLPQKNDMASPFVSSPPIMSPGVDMGHGLHTDFNSMPGMVATTPASFGSQQSQHQHSQQQSQQHHQQHQHQQHTMAAFQNLQANMSQASSMTLQTQSLNNGMGLGPGPGIDNPLSNRLGGSISGSNMMARQQPQRANSFAMPPHIRTVGDFQALQRANTGLGANPSLGPMTSLPMSLEPDMDFNALSR